MSTFLNDAKMFYHEFYDRKTWNDEYAKETLNGKEDINKRKECIRTAYKLILENPAVSDAVKEWVRTKLSMQEVANKFDMTSSMVKNQIYYVNTTLGRDLSYKDENIIKFCLYHEQIKDTDWNKVSKIIEGVKVKRAKGMYKKESIITNKNLLINIPRREYNTSLSDDDFNRFLRLITPYFINERKRIQKKINEEHLKEAGYFNYLLTPGINLSETDKYRLKKIKQLLDEDTLNTFKEEGKDRLLDISKIKEDEKTSDNMDYRRKIQQNFDEGINIEYSSKRVQY